MTSYPNLTFAMNAGEILDKLALQAICSDTIRSSLTDAERASCTSSGSLNGVSGTISQLEQSMTDPTQALQLAGGIPTPTSVMAEVSKYLTPVCTSSCSPPTSRTYDYSPPPDAPWASAYQRLSSRLPRLQLNAWDEASCPYNARYCVPFPGISLQAGPAHLCLPQLNNSLVTQLGSVISKQLDAIASSNATATALAEVNNAAGSILNSLDSLGVVAFLALILGVLYMALVRFFAKPVVWLSILLIFLLFLAGGAVALLKSIQCAEASLLDSTGQVLNVVENATGLGDTFAAPSLTCEPFGYAISNQDLRTVLRIVGYVLLGFAVLWMLLVICLRSRVRLAIAVNEVAAEFTAAHPTVILLPLVQMLLSLILLAAWGLIAGLIVTQIPPNYVPSEALSQAVAMGNATTPSACAVSWPPGFAFEDVSACQPSNTTGQELCWHCAAPRVVLNERFAFAFFSYLWHNALLAAIGQCIVAGAVGSWFFAERRLKGVTPVFCRATVNALIWHFGSLAFGSLILAIVQFLKWLMRFLAEQAKVRKNRILQTIFRILACCLWCFEKCIKYLNKNAYIQVAVKGTNFCTSAQNAFFLILRNAIRFGVLALLGPLVYFIGVLFMAGTTGLSGYYIFQAFHPEMNPVIPTILYVVIGYLIGRLFLSVFRLACDTSMQCFIMAEEMHQRGDFIPSALQSLIEKHEIGSGEEEGKRCC